MVILSLPLHSILGSLSISAVMHLSWNERLVVPSRLPKELPHLKPENLLVPYESKEPGSRVFQL